MWRRSPGVTDVVQIVTTTDSREAERAQVPRASDGAAV